LVAKPTAVKIGPSQDLSLKRSLSCGNQSYHCHGRFCYHPQIYPLLYHLILICSCPKVVSAQKKPISLLVVLSLCVLRSSGCLSPSLFFHRASFVSFVSAPSYMLLLFREKNTNKKKCERKKIQKNQRS
jgi:hypothetical protein